MYIYVCMYVYTYMHMYMCINTHTHTPPPTAQLYCPSNQTDDAGPFLPRQTLTWRSRKTAAFAPHSQILDTTHISASRVRERLCGLGVERGDGERGGGGVGENQTNLVFRQVYVSDKYSYVYIHIIRHTVYSVC